MGRFATTAPLYEQFRPPYPPEYFRAVAQKLGLSKQHALLISAPDQGFSHSALRLMSAASSASTRNRRCWRPRGNCTPNDRRSPGNCFRFDGPGPSCIMFSAKQEPICNFNPH
jgi:hypothetical protein